MAESDFFVIDWGPFDKFPEMTCTCLFCGTVYRSHAKVEGHLRARKPCPRCSNYLLRAARGDPEEFTISGERKG